ncbi:MAG: hypothetical protein ACYCVD_16745 [Desulfitobacteriaceae bacterium]
MLRRFNEWIGDKVSFWLSTMAAFWFVTILVLVPLIWQRPLGMVGWMQYGISVFFQGAALPVLGYVSRKAGESQEHLLSETHDVVMEELAIVKEELELAREERDELRILLAELHAKIH